MGQLVAKIAWAGGFRFEGKGTFGHPIATDISRRLGGEESGHRPTELLLWGIASCTGVDVVGILRKQRQELESLEIEVTGHQAEDYPKLFHTFEVKYIAKGRNLDPKKLAQAIELSEEKYCSVSQTVKSQTKIKTSYEIIE